MRTRQYVVIWVQKLYCSTVPPVSLSDGNFLSFTDDELLYRTRDGDVVKLNVDTKERTVVVPNQFFVSVVLLQRCVYL